MIAPNKTNVLIGIISYKRAMGLKRLLDSLCSLKFKKSLQPQINVIVIDNDVKRSAESICQSFSSKLKLVYQVEEQRGIPFARNAVLEFAKQTACDFLAFIDDDETADPYWLDELLMTQAAFSADVVSGPVVAVFAKPPMSWIIEGNFFERPRYKTGTIPELVACGNVLIKAELLRKDISFHEAFALTGGEDTLFFMRHKRLGAHMIWADDALVQEWVPNSRANSNWLVQRAFRGGNSYALIENVLGNSKSQKLKRVAIGVLRIGQGSCLALLSLGQKTKVVRALQKIALGMGMILGTFDIQYHEYKTIHS